jgi:hypothetical protein
MQTALIPLEKTLTEGGFSALPWLASGYCEPAKRDEVEQVFKPLLKTHPAMERSLALALESVSECVRLRQLWRSGFQDLFAQ